MGPHQHHHRHEVHLRVQAREFLSILCDAIIALMMYDNNQVVNSQSKHKTDMMTGNLGVVIQSLSPSASKVVVALAEAKTDLKNIIMILLTTTVTIIIIIIINCGLHLTLAIIAPTLQVVSE